MAEIVSARAVELKKKRHKDKWLKKVKIKKW
jgi:hypothetical protein